MCFIPSSKVDTRVHENQHYSHVHDDAISHHFLLIEIDGRRESKRDIIAAHLVISMDDLSSLEE
jgi:hypothetical protein